jgi:hypothetical protein
VPADASPAAPPELPTQPDLGHPNVLPFPIREPEARPGAIAPMAPISARPAGLR